MEIKDWEKEIEALNMREKQEIKGALRRLLNWPAFKHEYKEMETLFEMITYAEKKFKTFDEYWDTQIPQLEGTHSPPDMNILYNLSRRAWKARDRNA